MSLVSFRRAIARTFWRLSRWKLVQETDPVAGPRILIGAPHTSNIDFVLMLGIAWEARMHIHWLGKKELFRGIAGPIMRGLGGIPVDRSNAENVVAEVLLRSRRDDQFILVVTPEGTRSGKGWRSGFYRIAYAAGLPVTLGFVDRTTMTTGLGPTIRLTGEVSADMDRIREFYRDKAGVRPEKRTEPRLSDETVRFDQPTHQEPTLTPSPSLPPTTTPSPSQSATETESQQLDRDQGSERPGAVE